MSSLRHLVDPHINWDYVGDWKDLLMLTAEAIELVLPPDHQLVRSMPSAVCTPSLFNEWWREHADDEIDIT